MVHLKKKDQTARQLYIKDCGKRRILLFYLFIVLFYRSKDLKLENGITTFFSLQRSKSLNHKRNSESCEFSNCGDNNKKRDLFLSLIFE